VKTFFRIPQRLLDGVHADLSRPHAHALERVGFLACRVATVGEGGFALLAESYLPVADEDYEQRDDVGACINGTAIRKALQVAYNDRLSMVHVHRHEHRGVPRFSRLDLVEGAKFVPDFWKVKPAWPHGLVVLSQDAMAGLAWNPTTREPVPMTEMTVVGQPLRIWRNPHG